MHLQLDTLQESEPMMSETLPRQVWAFWFGPQMQGNRRQSYDNLNKRIGVPLVLVDDQNLANYTLPDHPIHPAFQYLTPVHKSVSHCPIQSHLRDPA